VGRQPDDQHDRPDAPLDDPGGGEPNREAGAAAPAGAGARVFGTSLSSGSGR
jgi:hypothetical protein